MVLDLQASHGEIKRTEVVLDLQASHGVIKSREVELSSEGWTFFVSVFLSSSATDIVLVILLRKAVETAIT